MAANLAPVYLDNNRVFLQGEPKPRVAQIIAAGGKHPDTIEIERLETQTAETGKPCTAEDIIDRTAVNQPIYLRSVGNRPQRPNRAQQREGKAAPTAGATNVPASTSGQAATFEPQAPQTTEADEAGKPMGPSEEDEESEPSDPGMESTGTEPEPAAGTSFAAQTQQQKRGDVSAEKFGSTSKSQGAYGTASGFGTGMGQGAGATPERQAIESETAGVGLQSQGGAARSQQASPQQAPKGGPKTVTPSQPNPSRKGQVSNAQDMEPAQGGRKSGRGNREYAQEQSEAKDESPSRSDAEKAGKDRGGARHQA